MTSGELRTLAEQRVAIRARLAAGTLPRAPNHQRTYAGYGEDQPCDGCGRRIGRLEVAYEIEFLENSSPTPTLTMHFGCFGIWVAESGFTGYQFAQAREARSAESLSTSQAEDSSGRPLSSAARRPCCRRKRQPWS
jgi:hypothetical protein